MIPDDNAYNTTTSLVLAMHNLRNNADVHLQPVKVQLPGATSEIKKYILKQSQSAETIVPGVTEVSYFGKKELVVVESMTIEIIDSLHVVRKEIIGNNICNPYHLCLLTMKVGESAYFRVPYQLMVDICGQTLQDKSEDDVQKHDTQIMEATDMDIDEPRDVGKITSENAVKDINFINNPFDDTSITSTKQKTENRSYYNIIITLKESVTQFLSPYHPIDNSANKISFQEKLEENLKIMQEIDKKAVESVTDSKYALRLQKEYMNIYDMRQYIHDGVDEESYLQYINNLDFRIISLLWKWNLYFEAYQFIIKQKILEFEDKSVLTFQLGIISCLLNYDSEVADQLLRLAIQSHGHIPELIQYEMEIQTLKSELMSFVFPISNNLNDQ